MQEEIQYELDRRRPGQSRITTPRNESDTCEVLSGMAPDGCTTLGSPICILVRNKDQKSQDYSEMALAYRCARVLVWGSLQLGQRVGDDEDLLSCLKRAPAEAHPGLRCRVSTDSKETS